MVSVSSGDFVHDGHRLVYYEYGSGSRPFLLLPGLLLPQTMHRPLAQALAERGNRVITLDLLGHGEADRPRDMWRYSMPQFGAQAVALLDHLEIDEAVVGGTSLGANVTLEAAVHAPDRMRGLVIEMPVLDNALLGCALAFTPLLVGLTFGEPLARLFSRAMGRALRNGRLIERNSILELRLAPARLTGEIARYLDECWRGPARAASDEARQASA